MAAVLPSSSHDIRHFHNILKEYFYSLIDIFQKVPWQSLASPLQCSDDACAPRNTVAVATCSLTILCFYCPVPYSTLLCLTEFDELLKADHRHIYSLYQLMFYLRLNISVTAFGVCPGSTDSVVETQGGGINIDVKAFYMKIHTGVNAGRPGRRHKVESGPSVLKDEVNVTLFFFFFLSIDLRSLQAAINKAPETMQN